MRRITNPIRMAAWNPKIVSVDRRSECPVCLAERFGMTVRMSGQVRPTLVEVIACEAPSILTLCYQTTEDPRTGFVEEMCSGSQAFETKLTSRGTTTLIRDCEVSVTEVPSAELEMDFTISNPGGIAATAMM